MSLHVVALSCSEFTRSIARKDRVAMKGLTVSATPPPPPQQTAESELRARTTSGSTFSFAYKLALCVSTMRGESVSARPISLLVRPATMRPSTSRSRVSRSPLARLRERSCWRSAFCSASGSWPDPLYGTGALGDVAIVTQPVPKARGRWNTFLITAKGPASSSSLKACKRLM